MNASGGAETDDAVFQRKQRKISSLTDETAGFELGSFLAD